MCFIPFCSQNAVKGPDSAFAGVNCVPRASIDALGDSPEALARWLARFGAQPGWLAAVPRVADVDRIIERLGMGGEPRPAGNDPHTGQIYLLNRRAELVLRTPSMPAAAQVLAALRDTAQRFG